MTPDMMRENLQRLRRLPNDWDGENSPKITEQAIESCKGIIQAFEDTTTDRLIKIGAPSVDYPAFLYPMIGGGLSFMWEGDNFSRILIMPDGAIVHRTKGE